MVIASSQLSLQTRSLLFSHNFPCRNSWGWISPWRSAALKWWCPSPTPRKTTAIVPCLCHISILLICTVILKWRNLRDHVQNKSTDSPSPRCWGRGSALPEEDLRLPQGLHWARQPGIPEIYTQTWGTTLIWKYKCPHRIKNGIWPLFWHNTENFRFSEKSDIKELEFSLQSDIHLSGIIQKYILEMSFFFPFRYPHYSEQSFD